MVDYVTVDVPTTGGFDMKALGFKSDISPLTAGAGAGDNTKKVSLMGRTNGNVENVTAYYTVQDKEGKSYETTLGQVNVVTYDKSIQQLVIVPVNNANLPDKAAIQNALDKIY